MLLWHGRLARALAARRAGGTPTPRKEMKLRGWKIIVAQVVLMGLSLLFCAPFLWILSTSFKTSDRLQSEKIEFVPRASYITRNGADVRVKALAPHLGKLAVQIQEG